MSRKSIKSNISSKFVTSPYLNSVRSSTQLNERGKKNRDEEQHEEQHATETVVSERPRRSTRRRGERRSGSSGNSVKSNVTSRSTKTRSSSPMRLSSRMGRPKIDILLPSEVERLLISFSSKYKNEDHPMFVVGGSDIAAQDDEVTIASASHFDDYMVYKECEDEVFSSDLFAHILVREPDQD